CTVASSPTAAVVTMAQVSSWSPQTVQRPAKASTAPSSRVMKYGWRSLEDRRTHSYQPSAGTRQRRDATDAADARAAATGSARALMLRAATLACLADEGTRPHRATDSTGCSTRRERRTTGTGSVGATL